MKAFIALCVLAFVAGTYGLTDEQRAKGEQVVTSCITTESVTEDDVKQLKGGDFSNASRNIRCFARCFLEGVEFLDADGNLAVDRVVEKLSNDDNREKIQAAVDACKDINDEDRCDKAYNLYKCYAEHQASPN